MRRVLIYLILIVFVALVASCSSGPSQEAPVGNDTLAKGESADFYKFDEPPVLVEFVQPEYPEAARSSGLEGDVMIRVMVDTDGHVRELKVLDSSDTVFEPAALAAASHWVFTPAKLENEVTRSFVAVPVKFALD